MRFLKSLRIESGQSTVGYAGIGLVVVVLLAVIAGGAIGVTTNTGQTILCKIGNEISSIGGGGGQQMSCGVETDKTNASAGNGKADTKMPESCTTSTSTDSGSGYVKIGFIKIGSSFALVTQEEKYLDPKTGEVKTRYSVVATDGASIGAEGGIGTKGEVNDSGLGADLSAEAGFDVKAGDTWEFNSEQEMKAFLKDYEAYRIQQMQITNDTSGGYALYLALSNGWLEPPRSSDKTSISGGFQAKANGNAGARLGKDTDTDSSVDLNIGLYAEAKAGKEYARQTDRRKGHEGEYTDTVTYSGSIGGGANAVFAGVSGTGSYEGAMSTTYDKNKKLTEITFTQKTSGDVTWNATNGPVKGNGDATGSGNANSSSKETHVTTTTLKVTDENRATVEAWLAKAYLVDPQSGAPALMVPKNVLNPDSPSPKDAMQQLLYEHATSTDSTYNVDGDDFSIGGEVALGLKVGAGISAGHEDSTIKQQTYLGERPSAGATRPRKVTEWCSK